MSFTKDEIMDIVDTQGKWWQAKKADGTIGSAHSLVYSLVVCLPSFISVAPSNFLQIVNADRSETSSRGNFRAISTNPAADDFVYKAKALYDCGSSVDHFCVSYSKFDLQTSLPLTIRMKYHSRRMKS